MSSFKITDYTTECIDAAHQKVLRALETIGEMAETAAKGLAPVDKTGISGPNAGALRNSITHSVDEDKMQVAVGSTIFFAPYVELGTGNLYEPPPEWLEAQAKRGRGLSHWIYKGGDGKWHHGYPRQGKKFLQTAIKNNMENFKNVMESELRK